MVWTIISAEWTLKISAISFWKTSQIQYLELINSPEQRLLSLPAVFLVGEFKNAMQCENLYRDKISEPFTPKKVAE